MLAQVIDAMADGKGRPECFKIINDYYVATINRDLARSSFYEIYDRAKAMWLTNVSLPALENYKKEMILKSDNLEEEVKKRSTKDIVDQAKVIKDIWTYRDNLVGLGSDTPTDSIVISINNNPKRTIASLEINEEE